MQTKNLVRDGKGHEIAKFYAQKFGFGYLEMITGPTYRNALPVLLAEARIRAEQGMPSYEELLKVARGFADILELDIFKEVAERFCHVLFKDNKKKDKADHLRDEQFYINS